MLRLIDPDPRALKRFFAPLLLFIFGMFAPFVNCPAGWRLPALRQEGQRVSLLPCRRLPVLALWSLRLPVLLAPRRDPGLAYPGDAVIHPFRVVSSGRSASPF